MTPDKAEQRKEAADRLKTGVDPMERVDALDVVADSTTPDDLPPQRTQPQADPEAHHPPQRARSSSDEKRAAIVGRFRQQRTEAADADTDADDIRAFARAGMPPELAPPPVEIDQSDDEVAPPVVEAEAPPPVAQPTKRKLLVRGQERELTEDEIIAAAQKSLAAEDYLGEAKETARAITEEARRFEATIAAARAAGTGKHPADSNDDAHPAEPVSDQTRDSEHPADPRFVKVVEAIQFGEPAEAARQLTKLVNEEAARNSRDTVIRDKLADESVRSTRFLTEFKDKHPEIANDPRASAAIERDLYDLQVEDLRKIAPSLGLKDDQLPTSPAEIADWHKYYRAHGQPIRSASELLTTATDGFLEWKGVKKAASSPPVAEPRDPKPAPRLAVNIDRAARLANVQQQPTRTVTPRPDASNQPPPQRDRSDVVRQMISARGKPRGRVVA